MAKNEEKYFLIDPEQLPSQQQLFRFHLYLYNPEGKKYTTFIHANSPLTPEKRSELDTFLSKGAKLAISIGQKRTFLKSLGLSEDDVPSLKVREKHRLEEEREQHVLAQAESLEIKAESELKKELSLAIEEDRLNELITMVRNQILLWKVTVSPTTTLAIELSKKLLTQDNFTNRVVTLSFLFAKLGKIENELQLGDLICAAFLHHVGLTQLDCSYSLTPQQALKEDQVLQYQRHPYLAQHLIKKNGPEISDQCLKIINEHHERAEGTGYPNQKKSPHISPLALILGASSHIIEFSSGKITGKKTPLASVFHHLKNKNPLPGLEFGFGDIMEENLKIV